MWTFAAPFKLQDLLRKLNLLRLHFFLFVHRPPFFFSSNQIPKRALDIYRIIDIYDFMKGREKLKFAKSSK